MSDYSRELNKGMKVFSQLFVGLNYQGESCPHLGFATPLEKGSAFEKRKETILKWLGGTRRAVIENGRYKLDEAGAVVYEEVALNTVTLDNTPRPGFKVTDDVKRVYWGGGNVVWRVLDPSGFELEIQSQNLMALIQVAGVGAGGEIPGNCVWGRSGKDNILLHEGSQEYQNAIIAAETLKAPALVNKSSQVIGAKYLLRDASEGIFLGKFWVTTEREIDPVHDRGRGPYVGTTQMGEVHVPLDVSTYSINEPEQFDAVLFGQLDSLNDGYISFYKKAPLVRQLNPTEKGFDAVRAAEVVSVCKQHSFASSSKNDTIVHVSLEKFTKFKYVAVKIDQEQFAKQFGYLKRQAGGYFSSPQRISAGETFSAGDFDFFSVYTKKYGVQIDGVCYGGKIRIYKQSHSRIQDFALGEVKFENSSIEMYHNNNYGYNGGFGYYDIRGYGQENRPAVKVFENFELPKFSTLDALTGWINDLNDSDKLVQFVVEAVKN